MLEQVKRSETDIRNDLENIMEKLEIDNEKVLRSQFPDGYQLFVIIEKQIIQSPKPVSEYISIKWSTGKILKVTDDFLEILIPTVLTSNGNVMKGNTTTIPNKEGLIISSGYGIANYSIYITIIQSDKDKVIAAIGFKKSN